MELIEQVSEMLKKSNMCDFYRLFLFLLQEDSLQFFKEESVDGAVYNLYLKKVRYHTPTDDVGIDGVSSNGEPRMSTWYRKSPPASTHPLTLSSWLAQAVKKPLVASWCV